MSNAVRRESYPIARPIQARPAAGIGIAQMQQLQGELSISTTQIPASTRHTNSMQSPSSVPWPSPNHLQNTSNHNQHPSAQPPLYPPHPSGLMTSPPRPASNVVYQVTFISVVYWVIAFNLLCYT